LIFKIMSSTFTLPTIHIRKHQRKKNCNIQPPWEKIMPYRMYQKQNLLTSLNCAQTSQEIKIVSPCVTIIYEALLSNRRHAAGCGIRYFYNCYDKFVKDDSVMGFYVGNGGIFAVHNQ